MLHYNWIYSPKTRHTSVIPQQKCLLSKAESVSLTFFSCEGVFVFEKSVCIMTAPRRITHHLKPRGNPALFVCVCVRACVSTVTHLYYMYEYCVIPLFLCISPALPLILHHLSISRTVRTYEPRSCSTFLPDKFFLQLLLFWGDSGSELLWETPAWRC